MYYHKLFCSLLTILPVAQSFSQTFEKEKLDKYFKIMDSGDRFMGNVVVYQHGKKVYSNAIGFSNLHSATKADEQTMYRIGSISKTITAALVLKAVEEGKLRLTDTINSFFPSVKHADQITISHLLNHHSGIHNFTGGNFINWSSQHKNRSQLIDSITKGGSDFLPGTKAAYSNSNYVLLSFILEDIYHKPYKEILDGAITKPLGLKFFQFGDNMIDPKIKSLSYNFEAGWIAGRETDLSIPMGAGSIVSSADNLARVLEAIFQGKIISKQMLRKMQEQSDGFGYGIFEKTVLGKTAYTHDGAIDGFTSYFYYFLQEEMIYVLLSNAENYKLESVNETILSILFKKPIELPALNTYKVKPDDLQLYAGRYISQNSPLIIDISVRNNYLLAQPHGQSIYTMEATDKDEFFHAKTGVTLNFVPTKKQMFLKQREQTILFTRQ